MAPITDYRTYFLKQYVASVQKMGLKSQLEEYLEAEHMRNIPVQPSLQPSGLKGHRLQATSGNLHFSILDVVGYPGRLIMQGSMWPAERTFLSHPITARKQEVVQMSLIQCHRHGMPDHSPRNHSLRGGDDNQADSTAHGITSLRSRNQQVLVPLPPVLQHLQTLPRRGLPQGLARRPAPDDPQGEVVPPRLSPKQLRLEHDPSACKGMTSLLRNRWRSPRGPSP